MDGLQQFLNEMAPWGLTVGQSAAVLLASAGLVILWTALGMLLRLAGKVFRVGCALILIFACGCIATLIFMNLTRAFPR